MIKVSGTPKEYCPRLWNKVARVKYYFNCYCYALDIRKRPNIKRWDRQPGDFAGMNIGRHFDWIERAVRADANAMKRVFYQITNDEIIPQGMWKIALAIADDDYHWYRQNPDGTWSHKPGTTDVRLLYNKNGSLCYNPASDEADRGKYKYFIAFYAISESGRVRNNVR